MKYVIDLLELLGFRGRGLTAGIRADLCAGVCACMRLTLLQPESVPLSGV